MLKFNSLVTAKIVELRLPFSGTISAINFTVGTKIKKGHILIKLDNTILEKRLQKELKDYEIKRAVFEKIKEEHKDSLDPVKKFILEKTQAELDKTILAVELAKFELEKAKLTAPADGTVIDDSNIITGQNITPAFFSLKFLVDGTMKIISDLNEEKLSQIGKDQYVEFKPLSFPDRVYKGRILKINPLPKKKRGLLFSFTSVLENYEGLRFGMKGEIKVFNK